MWLRRGFGGARFGEGLAGIAISFCWQASWAVELLAQVARNLRKWLNFQKNVGAAGWIPSTSIEPIDRIACPFGSLPTYAGPNLGLRDISVLVPKGFPP